MGQDVQVENERAVPVASRRGPALLQPDRHQRALGPGHHQPAGAGGLGRGRPCELRSAARPRREQPAPPKDGQRRRRHTAAPAYPASFVPNTNTPKTTTTKKTTKKANNTTTAVCC